MIIIDNDAESFVFADEWEVIIPLDFIKTEDGTLTITAYPSVESVAREFYDLYANDPFSDSALLWLKNALSPYMQKWGYEDDEQERLLYCYAADNPLQINTRAILPETDFVDFDIDYRIFAENYGEDDEVYYEAGRLYLGIIEEGELVAYAATSTRYDKTLQGRVDIGVDVLPEYRGKGYDTSSMAALALFVCQNGRGVEYKCPKEDEAARKMAQRAGLSEIGKQYFYIGRKIT